MNSSVNSTVQVGLKKKTKTTLFSINNWQQIMSPSYRGSRTWIWEFRDLLILPKLGSDLRMGIPSWCHGLGGPHLALPSPLPLCAAGGLALTVWALREVVLSTLSCCAQGNGSRFAVTHALVGPRSLQSSDTFCPKAVNSCCFPSGRFAFPWGLWFPGAGPVQGSPSLLDSLLDFAAVSAPGFGRWRWQW